MKGRALSCLLLAMDLERKLDLHFGKYVTVKYNPQLCAMSVLVTKDFELSKIVGFMRNELPQSTKGRSHFGSRKDVKGFHLRAPAGLSIVVVTDPRMIGDKRYMLKEEDPDE